MKLRLFLNFSNFEPQFSCKLFSYNKNKVCATRSKSITICPVAITQRRHPSGLVSFKGQVGERSVTVGKAMIKENLCILEHIVLYIIL